MYGNIGVKDQQVIDQRLARLRKGAVVVNLGCGPNQYQLHNLASAIGRYQFESTLILADRETGPIRGFRAPPPRKVDVVTLNAATATSVLGKGAVDLVLAFGLFGALSASTSCEGTGKDAWPVVLKECLQLLKPLGNLIVTNSCDRQPFPEFRTAVECAGFIVVYHHESASVLAVDNPRERRYLIECRRPGNRGAA